ncbi:ATP-binding protein [Robertkochia flava]|uniref:ATP-binding protein n=1 Tax=Robertkochia flava TaxID=3447986 RepID=UPI001CD015BF|nr:ATP-binding protein [Robertkochia marina]
MHFKIFYILLLLSCVNLSRAQSLDSLRTHVFKSEKLAISGPSADTLRIDRLNEHAEKFLHKNMDSLSHYAGQAIILADQMGYAKGQINARYLKSIYLTDTGHLDQALELLDESERIARGCKDDHLLMRCYINRGSFYNYAGDIGTSNDFYMEAIKLGEKMHTDHFGKVVRPNINNKISLSLAYEGLAANYQVLKYYDKALEYINKADRVNQQIGDDLFTGQTLANKAEIHLDLKQYEDALIHISESIDLFKEKKDIPWQAFAERVKGDIFLKQGYYQLALESYEVAQELQEQIDDSREKASLDNAISKAFLGIKNNNQSKSYAKMALEEAMKLGELAITKESAKTLSFIYEKEEQYNSALYYHKIYKKYEDSLFNEKNMKSAASLEVRIDAQEREAQLQMESEKAQNKQRMFTFFSTGGVLILLTVLFLTQRSRKLERKLNDLLTKKNRVLGRRELQLKWLNETKNKLFSIISHDLRAPIASLNNLIDLLNDKQIGPEEFIDFAPQLSNQVKNVSFTLNNLLLWSKHQMKGARNNPRQHNLHKLASLSIDLLLHQAQQKNIAIRNEIPKEAEIYSDADQITIVFRNLISNAIKFTEPGGAVILYAEEKEGIWQVEVKDNGIGMDQKTIDRILSQSSSYMESTYGTNNEKGTGIGLSLCKEMITKGGGEFHIQSAIGVGSSFSFTIEKYEKEVQEIQEPSEVLEQ